MIINLQVFRPGIFKYAKIRSFMIDRSYPKEFYYLSESSGQDNFNYHKSQLRSDQNNFGISLYFGEIFVYNSKRSFVKN